MSALRTSARLAFVMGLGYGMWWLLVPGEQMRKDASGNLPESHPLRMEENRKKNVLVMQAMKEAAGIHENIVRETGQIRK